MGRRRFIVAQNFTTQKINNQQIVVDRDLLNEAFFEAQRRHPHATEALSFLYHAAGFSLAEPTQADFAWAQIALEAYMTTKKEQTL